MAVEGPDKNGSRASHMHSLVSEPDIFGTPVELIAALALETLTGGPASSASKVSEAAQSPASLRCWTWLALVGNSATPSGS